MSCHSVNEFKPGQKVKVTCLIHSVTPDSCGIATPSDECNKKREWEVVAVNVKGLPSNGWQDANGNDVILKEVGSCRTLYVYNGYIKHVICQPKNGDIVEVNDGSYSMKFDDGKLSHSYGCELKGRRWKVIQTGLKNLPTDNCGGCMPKELGSNDTMLQEIDGKNTILFIHSSFLRLWD